LIGEHTTYTAYENYRVAGPILPQLSWPFGNEIEPGEFEPDSAIGHVSTWFGYDTYYHRKYYIGWCVKEGKTILDIQNATTGDEMIRKCAEAGGVRRTFSTYFHNGLDISVTGERDENGQSVSKVLAVADGVVDAVDADGGGDYGKYVIIKHGSANTGYWYSQYCHLDEVSVKKDDTISVSDPIGNVGCTGHCFGMHLHLIVYWKEATRVYTNLNPMTDQTSREMDPCFASYDVWENVTWNEMDVNAQGITLPLGPAGTIYTCER